MSVFPYAVAGWIFLVGVYGMVTSRDLVHAVGCLAVTQSSTYVLLLAVGYRSGGTAPVFSDIPTDRKVVDPVVQALTLTDIVVGATVTALLLALVIQIQKRHDTVDPDELSELKG
jgi:multicomponent Na+:H+ antiporter subunit C